MFDSRGLPDYPPPYNAWQFPPPPISRGWKWLVIVSTVVGLVAGTTMLGVLISVGAKGLPGLIDDPELISVIEDECEAMTSTVERTPVVGSARQQAAAIADQNRAIDAMVAGIRSKGRDELADDRPADLWLADWERLVAAREAYAQMVLEGRRGELEIPQDQRGEDIYLRMDDAFVEDTACEVPTALLTPFPDEGSDI